MVDLSEQVKSLDRAIRAKRMRQGGTAHLQPVPYKHSDLLLAQAYPYVVRPYARSEMENSRRTVTLLETIGPPQCGNRKDGDDVQERGNVGARPIISAASERERPDIWQRKFVAQGVQLRNCEEAVGSANKTIAKLQQEADDQAKQLQRNERLLQNFLG